MNYPRYRIRDWHKHFENNRTRELKRLEWVPIPNRMDTEAYAELVDHPNAAAHLGAWIAIVEIASRQDVRGELPCGPAGIPQALARISRLPIGLFEEVLVRLIQIQWIEPLDEIPQEGAGIPQEGAARVARAQDSLPFCSIPDFSVPNKENPDTLSKQKSKHEKAIALSQSRFADWWAAWSAIKGTAYHGEAVRAWLSAVPDELGSLAIECTASYLGSLENPAKGFNPHTFLFQQARDGFLARWPMCKKNGARQTEAEAVLEFRERMARERRA